MKRVLFFLALGAGLAACCGCDSGSGKRRNASGSIGGVGLPGAESGVQPASAPQPSAPPAAPAPQAAGRLPTAVPAIPGAPQLGSLPGQAPQPPSVVSVPAQAGVTGKGNYSSGLITTPVSVYFQTKERVVFEIQIPHAMQLYQALNDRKPRTHEEFMKEIIQANSIKLPDLPQGHTYKYDPMTGTLMVEHPQ